MFRGCAIAAGLWIALVVAYSALFFGRVPVIGLLVIATAVWLGLVMMHGAGYALRDWRARNRMARGERPRDGELVSAVGEVRATLDVLHAPFSGAACVYYSYEIGKRREGEENGAREYTGYGMARCAVHTPYGTFTIGSVPAVEGFAKTRVNADAARAYLAATPVRRVDGLRDLFSALTGVYKERPPLKVDWQLGDPDLALDQADIEETIIEPGATVTVTGRYDSASNAIVSDPHGLGVLRLRAGGNAREVSSFPAEAVWKFVGGAVVVVAANAFLYVALIS